jgi:hypothetical protein
MPVDYPTGINSSANCFDGFIARMFDKSAVLEREYRNERISQIFQGLFAPFAYSRIVR